MEEVIVLLSDKKDASIYLAYIYHANGDYDRSLELFFTQFKPAEI